MLTEDSEKFEEVAWSPDGSKIATAFESRTTARVWSSSSGNPLLTLTGDVWSVAWLPKGCKIAPAFSDGIERVWSSSSGENF
jgi:WD40 repeat protein